MAAGGLPSLLPAGPACCCPSASKPSLCGWVDSKPRTTLFLFFPQCPFLQLLTVGSSIIPQSCSFQAQPGPGSHTLVQGPCCTTAASAGGPGELQCQPCLCQTASGPREQCGSIPPEIAWRAGCSLILSAMLQHTPYPGSLLPSKTFNSYTVDGGGDPQPGPIS